MRLILYRTILEKYLKDTCLEQKTHKFIVMLKYNQMIDIMVEEFVKSKITKTV